MRSFVLSARERRSETRSSNWAVLAASLGIAVLLAGGAAHAAPAAPSITNGLMTTQIAALPPILAPQTTAITPSVSRDVNHHLTGLAIGTPPAVVQTTSFIVPVTDPAAAPIKGILATVKNGPANFAAGGGPGGGFGGQMGLIGINKVCLFGPCSAAVANLNVPVSVVGVGGAGLVTGAVNLTVVGAPWTTMTAAIGTVTQMGSLLGAPTIVPGGTTQMTSDHLKLVTPIFISTNIGPSAVVPVFGIFEFVVTTATTTPEPTTIAALGASIAALVTVGISRRRKS